jgi:hypothetical protein
VGPARPDLRRYIKEEKEKPLTKSMPKISAVRMTTKALTDASLSAEKTADWKVSWRQFFKSVSSAIYRAKVKKVE